MNSVCVILLPPRLTAIMPPQRILPCVYRPPMWIPPCVWLASGCFAGYFNVAPSLCVTPSRPRGTGLVALRAFGSKRLGICGPPLACRLLPWEALPLTWLLALPGPSWVPVDVSAVTAPCSGLFVACGAPSKLARTGPLLGLPFPGPECHAILPSQHALAAHLHRMHGQVALST